MRKSSLHSNMFLLIHLQKAGLNPVLSAFTFQYVSINTTWRQLDTFLIPCFTFQYVSINIIGGVLLKKRQ